MCLGRVSRAGSGPLNEAAVPDVVVPQTTTRVHRTRDRSTGLEVKGRLGPGGVEGVLVTFERLRQS